MRILAIGDSMTWREEPNGKPWLPDRPEHGYACDTTLKYYPKYLAELLDAEVYAFSAFKKDDDCWMNVIAAWTIEASTEIKPDWVIVQGGGDDLDRGTPLPEVLDAYKRIYNEVVGEQGRGLLFLMVPWAHKQEGGIEQTQRNRLNTALCDLYGPRRTKYYHTWLLEHGLLGDGVHPSDEGDKAMARIVAAHIERNSAHE